MNKIIFRQLLDYIPQKTFRRIAQENERSFHGNKKLTAWEQFICMSFAQLTFSSGLREIQSSLQAMQHKLYHLGLNTKIAKSTLARANNRRPSIIFKKLTLHLIKKAEILYENEQFLKEINETVFIIDSTFIRLCLSLFDWGQVGKQNYAGLKIHTLLRLNGHIPSMITVSNGSAADNKFLDEVIIEPGAFYVMDKAYVDFKRLNRINQCKAYFVVRVKKNINFIRTKSLGFDMSKGVLADQKGVFGRKASRKIYYDEVRKIVFHDKEKNKQIEFLTNNFSLAPEHITLLYKKRWEVEIFFKWTKQNLRIKKFYGTSFNAVETQIWIAVSTYLLILIAKKELQIKLPLHQILQILSFSLFENISLSQLLNSPKHNIEEPSKCNQLNLFE